MENASKKVLVLGVDGLIPELVERFCAEGVLPNIQRLLDEGGYTRLLPFISTWGDTNWVCFLTGQAPGNSWVGQRIPPSDTQHLLEIMASEIQKAALVHFPESLMPVGSEDYCLAPFWSGKGPAPMEMASAALHSTQPSPAAQAPQESLGWPPSSGTLAHHHKNNRYAIEYRDNSFQAAIHLNDGGQIALHLTIASEASLTIDFEDQQTTLTRGQWSEWLPVVNAEHRGCVRFKLLALEREQRHVELLQSQITIPMLLGNQPALTQELIERHGPFISKWAVTASPDEPWFETSFEEARYQLNWLAKAACMLLNEHDYRLFATVFRLNDETHHTCLAQCDPESPFYLPDDHNRYLAVIRKAYKVLDEGVGELLRHRRDDTIIVLASDHGDVPNRYLCNIYRRLEEFNLCTLDDQGQVVLQRSQAFLKNERGGLEVFVNLRDRYSTGTVANSDYERVQTQILKALTTWYCETPDGERNVVALAMKKQDASMLGYWGPYMGDVLFAYSPGFVWGTNLRGDTLAELNTPGANHGPQVPTARTKFASNHGMAIFHGHGIRQGERLPFDTAIGIQRMDNAGATIAQLLSLQNTSALDGHVMVGLLTRRPAT